MENLVADFVQFSRARAKTFLNFPHFQRSFKSFGIFFSNSYIYFMVITIRLVLKGNYGKRLTYFLFSFVLVF